MLTLIDERNKKYVVDGKKDFHTDLGVIKAEDIQNSKPGSIIKTHLGHEMKVIKANVNDYIDVMERKCTIILPKDIGIVITYTGIGCGDKVVEAGTGAGATTLRFSRVLGNEGKIYTYEKRKEFYEIAKRNIEKFGVKNVVMRYRDIRDGIIESDVDLVFLDMPDPWNVVEHAYEALKYGGWFVSYSPYVEQMKKTRKKCEEFNFSEIFTYECLLREMEIKNDAVRPKTRMIGHTAYITFARKVP